MHKGQKSWGDMQIERDALGQLLVVPYFCRKGCFKGWPTKKARSCHERTHNPRVAQKGAPKPEPEPGTVQHYHWTKRNNVETPRVDKDAWAKDGRDRRALKGAK